MIKKLSNINLNIGIKNYGICEDIFQSVMHMISQSIRKNYIKNKNIIFIDLMKKKLYVLI